MRLGDLPGPAAVAGAPARAARVDGAAGAKGLAPWLDLTCRSIPGMLAGMVVHSPGCGADFLMAAAWPGQAGAMHLLPLSERCLAKRAMQVHDAGGALAVALPLGEASIAGVLVLEARTAAIVMADLVAVATVAARYLQHVLLGQPGAAQDGPGAQPGDEAALLAVLCRPAPFPSTALELVNWLATRLACQRVALGIAHGGRIRLRALSHSAWFERNSHAAAALESAMDEACDQRQTVVVPPLPGCVPVLAIAHCSAAAGMAACSVVLPGGGGLGLGVLYLERLPGAPFSPAEVALIERLAQTAGPVLEARHEAWRWVGGRTRAGLAALGARLRDPRRPALRAGVVLAGAALAAVTLIDGTWRLAADAAIEGEQQRVIPVPFDGFLAGAAVKAGLVVRKGDTLAELDTRQLLLEERRWRAEEAQHDSRYRDALARHERPAAALSLAQMKQAQAQLLLAQDRLAHARLVAPFDAYVVAGDLSQQIGSPLEQGKTLFELAPLDAYRAVLKVDERDVRAVRIGQRGELVLAGMPGRRLGFAVTNIAVAEAAQGRNTFRVEARLDQRLPTLRPGMQGVARVDAGQRSLLWIWTHSAWHWLQLQLWKWWP